MYKINYTLVAIVISFSLLVGCDVFNNGDDDGQSPPTVVQQASVFNLSDTETVGSSELERTDQGLSFMLESTKLEPGAAVTLWLVVFNNPDQCSGTPCAIPEDLENPDTNTDAMFADGLVVDESGVATFIGRHRMGDNSGSMIGPIGAPSPGLINTGRAEIQLLVHTHGPMIPEYMPSMIQSYAGGCAHPGPPFPDPLPFDRPAEWGLEGPNQCLTIQAAVFSPE